MRITGISIERFGVWRDLSLNVPADGLTVLYGPNETGKSTMMRFIRGMLYGFPPEDERRLAAADRRMQRSGQLEVEHQRQRFSIRRTAGPDDAGKAVVQRADSSEFTSKRLEDLLSGTNETLFQSVFALGLTELQELGTLHDDEVANHIYALTLGHQGNDLFSAQPRLEAAQSKLLSIENGGGLLPQLVAERRQLQRQFAGHRAQRDRYRTLLKEQNRLEASLTTARTELKELQRQIQGFHYLDRVHKPWMRLRDVKRDIDRLPETRHVSENGLVELDRLLAEYEARSTEHRRLRDELNRLETLARELRSTTGLRTHACCLKRLDLQRSEMEDQSRRRQHLDAEIDQDQRELNQLVEVLGSKWTRERIDQLDDSPDAQAAFAMQAKRFREMQVRQHRSQRSYRRLLRKTRDRQVQLEARAAAWGLDVASLEASLIAERKRLGQFQQLAAWQLQADEMETSLTGLDRKLQSLHQRERHPGWVALLLVTFILAGLFFIGAGLLTAVHTSALVGAIYAILGLTTIAAGWAVHLHHEYDLIRLVTAIREQRRDVFKSLTDLQERIRRFATGRLATPTSAAVKTVGSNGTTVVRTGFPSNIRQELSTSPARSMRADGRSHATYANGISAGPQAVAVIDEPGASRASVHSVTLRETAAATTTPLGRRFRIDGTMLAQAARRLAEMEAGHAELLSIQSIRKRLAEGRSRLREGQRRFATARTEWCQTLRRLGYPETVDVDASLRNWRQILSARQASRRLERNRAEADRLRQSLGQFEHQVATLGRRFEGRNFDGRQPYQALDRWRTELQAANERRAEFKRHVGVLKSHRKTFETLSTLLEDLDRRRQATLKTAQVGTRAEYHERVQQAIRRRELDAMLQTAQREFDQIVKSQPDLAFTEQDMVQYDPNRRQEQLGAIKRQLEAAEKTAQELSEKLGAVKQELRALADDRQASDCRWKLARVDERLRESAADWYALGLGAAVMDELRNQFERDHQPEILVDASPYFQQLTLNKYHRIWTPLGRRQLSIEDDSGKSLPVELLSRGTREQLFLAVRMALVKQFQRRGVELPFVLDDVTVNYDQHRLEAAVDAVMEYAREGRQVLLFTSHLHLAQLFQSRQHEPIWLEKFRTDGGRSGKTISLPASASANVTSASSTSSTSSRGSSIDRANERGSSGAAFHDANSSQGSHSRIERDRDRDAWEREERQRLERERTERERSERERTDRERLERERLERERLDRERLERERWERERLARDLGATDDVDELEDDDWGDEYDETDDVESNELDSADGESTDDSSGSRTSRPRRRRRRRYRKNRDDRPDRPDRAA